LELQDEENRGDTAARGDHEHHQPQGPCPVVDGVIDEAEEIGPACRLRRGRPLDDGRSNLSSARGVLLRRSGTGSKA
jgi:hypothetical protein